MPNQKEMNSSKIVLVALVGCISFLILIVVFVSAGFVRQVPIYWKEEIRATVAFEEIGGQLQVVGLVGNSDTNPTLVMKAGDSSYIITVINQDTKSHIFYVDGLEVHTKLLKPGENDTVTLISKKEATYNYYDGLHSEKKIGQIIVVQVEAFE